MASNKMPGNLLGLEINGSFVSCETSCEFNFETDMKAASPVDIGRWKEVIPAVRSWSVTVNATMLIQAAGASAGTVLNSFLSGDQVNLRFMVKDTLLPAFILEGKAYVLNGSINSSVNTKASWNTTFTGNGAFTAVIGGDNLMVLATDTSGDDVVEDGNGELLRIYQNITGVDIQTITLPELETAAPTLDSYFAHSLPGGTLKKAKLSDLGILIGGGGGGQPGDYPGKDGTGAYGLWTIDITGNAATATIATYAYDSDKWDGYQFADYLNQPVRTTDTVRYAAISSTAYVSGFTGSGWQIDANGNATVDTLTVRKTLNVYELVINKISGTNGALAVSDTVKISNAVAGSGYYDCYIDTADNTIQVPFHVGDLIRCQQWNGRSIKYYLGQVIVVYGGGSGGFAIQIVDGAGVPAVGDVQVRFGNVSDTNRQGLLYLTASDTNAPYMDVLDGINSSNLAGKTKVRLGRLDGIVDAAFGALSGYGLYGQNVYLTGALNVTGGNAETKVGSKSYAAGEMLYKDPEFSGSYGQSGYNGISVYNNSSNGQVTLGRGTSYSDFTNGGYPANPNSTGCYLYMTYNGGGASPGYGGFTFVTATRANAVFITRIVALIPVGRNIQWGSNSYGVGGDAVQWLTPQIGTGNWEEYLISVKCGSTGTFSSTNFFYIDGGANTGFSWFLSYATVFDMTGAEVNPQAYAAYMANQAQQAAITYAAGDATTKAQNAQLAAIAAAAIDATNKSNTAQVNAISISSTNTSGMISNFSSTLDPVAFGAAIQLAKLGTTIVQGGYIVTGLVNASNIVTGTLSAARIDVAAIQAQTVTATYINSLSIDASAIKTGLLSAARIDVDNLVVRNLNTYGAGTKRVTINGSDNNFRIYNPTSDILIELDDDSVDEGGGNYSPGILIQDPSKSPANIMIGRRSFIQHNSVGNVQNFIGTTTNGVSVISLDATGGFEIFQSDSSGNAVRGRTVQLNIAGTVLTFKSGILIPT